MLDLRTPSGWFFALVGAILLVLGLAFPSLRAPLSQANVNAYVGLFMFLFGCTLLFLAHKRP